MPHRIPTLDQKVLIIDGHPVYIHKTEGFLKGLTYKNIILTQTAKDGLEKLDSEKPDVVILSGMLPDADAHDVCRAIREKSSAKIIVQTGLFTSPEDIRKFQQCGADRVIDRKEKDMYPLQEAVEYSSGVSGDNDADIFQSK